MHDGKQTQQKNAWIEFWTLFELLIEFIKKTTNGILGQNDGLGQNIFLFNFYLLPHKNMGKLLLNIYNKKLPWELLGTVSSYEEFLWVQFNNMKIQTFTYTDYVERVKKAVKDWYYFEDARGQN